ncbi:hypothetical protein [Haloarchaeobius sp. DT45]|uniref:hypothetical protein n=1 Tax=Haloarchaeobius sp. DT45 TaxID=3446116 RepID=UPI003F6A7A43
MGSRPTLSGTGGDQLALATARIWTARIVAITSTVEGAAIADPGAATPRRGRRQ